MSMVGDEINVDELGDIDWEEDNNDSEDKFEANYEVNDKNDDRDLVGNTAVQDEANAIVSQHLFGVPSFMRTLDLKAMHAPEFFEYANTGKGNIAAEDGKFSVRMEFGSRELGYGAGCDWLIQASLIRKKSCWEIRRYNGKHTCTMGTISQDHAKLDSDTIADAIRPLVEADPSIKVKSIIAEVQGKFNYTVSYCKAWLAKPKAVAKIFGDWEVSYQTLPVWLKAMTVKMPRSRVQIKMLPVYRKSEEVQGVRVQHRIFWSFYPCIVVFKHCKPLVQVNGMHLYGKCKGALLVAVAQDGNQNIVPIAFAIVEGYSRTEQEYNKNYQRLKERGEAYTQWCDEIGVERWVLAFDGGHRWGHMTTNLLEYINYVLKGARNLPVTALVRSTFYRLNELFTWKSTEAHERRRNGFTYSEFATKRVEESFRRAGNIVVNRFDRRNEMFEVREMQDGTIYTVNLAQRHCDCGYFQVERLPCRHVLACCANQCFDWQVYVHDVYKMSEICKVYRGEFVPMGDPSTWDRYEGAKVIANWTLRRVTKGRPKSTRYLNEMDSRDMRGPRRCTTCGRDGHSRSRCPQPAGPNSAGGH
ncbi:uncharacterized protein [Arachis hypogaea]|uniref:uncharacterized protein n=1 Tax=Arachis hypogaea TaxID=3818 RepID=UPI003B225877